jgi:ubiquinone/menaquinone biosynthesis C-methylase UbiE
VTHPNEYFMDDVREAKRLANKVDAEAWATRYVSPHLNGGRSVLDIACGPGVLAGAVAKAHPGAVVTGIDICPERFCGQDIASSPNLNLRSGDARSLPFADNTFDFVYCRFLLQYLADRDKAVSEMIRVCKPGGRILLQDLDGQLVWHYPEDRPLQEQINQVLSGLAKTGFDPHVGRKLYSIANAAGMADIEVAAESYHLYAGRIDDRNLELWETKLDIAMPSAARVLGGEDAANSLKARFIDYLKRDDTLTYSVVFTVVGTKPLVAFQLRSNSSGERT